MQIANPSFLTSLALSALTAVGPLAAAAVAAQEPPPKQQPPPQTQPPQTPPKEQPPEEKPLPTMQEAHALREAGDVKAAAAAFGRIATAQPENAAAVFFHAYTLHASGDLKAAHDRHLDAAKFEQFRPVALYNHACVHALWNETDMALQSLREAIDAGFGATDEHKHILKTDPELDSLRADPRFQALLGGNAPLPKLTEVEPARLFDFYVGEWEMVDGEIVESLVTVTPALGGRGLYVSMRRAADNAETATATYVFDRERKVWRQIWTGDTGQVITMAGALEGETIALRVETDTLGTALNGRSVFSDLTRDAFTYAWQTTSDDGKTWSTVASRTFRRRG